MSLPTLRFREFSNHWSVHKVGDVCDFIVPGRNRPTDFNGDIPWITTPDILQNTEITHSKKNLNISKAEAKKIGSKTVPKNSIIISCVGDLGLVAFAGRELIINQQLHAFIPNENVYFKFLLYALTIKKPYMEKVATKTAVPYMNKDNCNSIPVALPSLSEQIKIASFLSSVDEKISQLTQKHELLTQYKKGVTQQIFSQELRFKDDDGRDFPDWEVHVLGDLSDVRDGTHDSPKFYSSGYPLITSKNLLDSGRLDLENVSLISDEDFKKINKRSKVDCGDILFGMIGTIGNPVLVESSNFAIKNVALIKQQEKLENNFLSQYLKSTAVLKQFGDITVGNTQKFIALGKLRQLKIQLPSKLEQTKIANFLTAIDAKISASKTQLDFLKQYKHGLMQQMFV